MKTFTGPYINHRPVLTSFDYKNQETKKFNYSHLLLATDGLWDELNDEEVHSVAKKHVSSGDKVQKMSHKYFMAAMEKIKYRNNMSYENLVGTYNRRDLHDDISYVVINLE